MIIHGPRGGCAEPQRVNAVGCNPTARAVTAGGRRQRERIEVGPAIRQRVLLAVLGPTIIARIGQSDRRYVNVITDEVERGLVGVVKREGGSSAS